MLSPFNNDFRFLGDFIDGINNIKDKNATDIELTTPEHFKTRDDFKSHQEYLDYLNQLNLKLIKGLSNNNTFLLRLFNKDKISMYENLIKDIDDKKNYYRGLIDFEKKQKLEDTKNSRTKKELDNLGLNPLAIYKILSSAGVANNDLYSGGSTLSLSDKKDNSNFSSVFAPFLFFILGILKMLG